MDLEQQLVLAGQTPEDAKKLAENFVKGLKEVGLADAPDPLSEAVPAAFKTAPSNIPLDKVLSRIGVSSSAVTRYSGELAKAMNEFSINNKNRQSMFLAQSLHESAMLTATIENLNYSELGLSKVFKNYFDRNTAKKYARQPERIANRVYASRMGNGNEMSGDGWKYRGRGLIQLTGKDNYTACSKGLGVDLIKNPDYLLTPEGAARSAGWFWNSRNLNRTADAKDLIANTRAINGGLNGLDHRQELYNKLLNLI